MKTFFIRILEFLNISCYPKELSIAKGIALLIFLTSIQANAANLESENVRLAPGDKEVSTPQGNEVTGTVTDGEGEPLLGVTIVVKGTLRGVISDADGIYSIEAEPTATLVFTYIGFHTQEKVVGNQTQIDITLETDIIGLDEVVAVGYGYQKG